ncbi:hypothetical protein PC113_g25342 [Phytophthora cactorum]|uniref:Uncharacterized protein n=1 Tax=Phytophthora cactorum TaxID=29920 RepID=A0A8T0XU10_9STRA|nr:hypothetical protein PC112_g25449 [Phytophthora cactorum]KAG2794868.1 hypothetical protein PC113_g25342 [Phytophthora cactorum]KAG3016124.1 hypothetical protein PC121_g25095 [Phytophthora cactorum]KAG4034634.1 hypothetical protein PC123_g28696 [Phytophthora cactorum]
MEQPPPTSARFDSHITARFMEQPMRTSAQFDPF